MKRITVESIPIVVGREEDGRWGADIELMPGVMAYSATRESAIAAVRALALRVAADCIDHDRKFPNRLPKSFRWREPLEMGQGEATIGCLAPDRVKVACHKGSHRPLRRSGWPNYTFAFHDNKEIGPGLLAQIAKKTGAAPEDP